MAVHWSVWMTLSDPCRLTRQLSRQKSRVSESEAVKSPEKVAKIEKKKPVQQDLTEAVETGKVSRSSGQRW